MYLKRYWCHLKDVWDLVAHDGVQSELYKVKEVQKKFKWVDAQLKFKIPISLPLVQGERGELWTLVARQLIWTFFNFYNFI